MMPCYVMVCMCLNQNVPCLHEIAHASSVKISDSRGFDRCKEENCSVIRIVVHRVFPIPRDISRSLSFPIPSLFRNGRIKQFSLFYSFFFPFLEKHFLGSRRAGGRADGQGLPRGLRSCLQTTTATLRKMHSGGIRCVKAAAATFQRAAGEIFCYEMAKLFSEKIDLLLSVLSSMRFLFLLSSFFPAITTCTCTIRLEFLYVGRNPSVCFIGSH